MKGAASEGLELAFLIQKRTAVAFVKIPFDETRGIMGTASGISYMEFDAQKRVKTSDKTPSISGTALGISCMKLDEHLKAYY